MRRLLYILCVALALVGCRRRDLTYGYYDTSSVKIVLNWSMLSATPTGMSIYCYSDNGLESKVIETNSVGSAMLDLKAGSYKLLVFNQIPSDFGSLKFSGLDSYDSAEVTSVATSSKWAEAKAGSDLVKEPDELAAATYVDLVISADEVRRFVELRASGTKVDASQYRTIRLTPQVVVKDARVRVRVSGVKNYNSTRATIYGMSDGYNFSEQKSFSTKATYLLESWKLARYSDGVEGEITTYFLSFGMPEQPTKTRSYEQWDGRLDIDILLSDLKHIVSESIGLHDKVTVVTDEAKAEAGSKIDINVDTGYGLDHDPSSSDRPIVLPDVESKGPESGFDADIDEWGGNVSVDVPIS